MRPGSWFEDEWNRLLDSVPASTAAIDELEAARCNQFSPPVSNRVKRGQKLQPRRGFFSGLVAAISGSGYNDYLAGWIH
jgi:hypothetical protein